MHHMCLHPIYTHIYELAALQAAREAKAAEAALAAHDGGGAGRKAAKEAAASARRAAKQAAKVAAAALTQPEAREHEQSLCAAMGAAHSAPCPHTAHLPSARCGLCVHRVCGVGARRRVTSPCVA